MLLDVLAAVSVLMVGLLGLGFVGEWWVLVTHSFNYAPSTYRAVQFGVDRGRVTALWSYGSHLPPRKNHFSSLHEIRIWPPHAPDRRRSLWEFEARRLYVTAISEVFVLRCPIWCSIVLFLIPPILWVRKRRKKRGIARGFAVENVMPGVDVVTRR